MTTLDEAILMAMRALTGVRHIDEVRQWIEQNLPERWEDVGTAMADLTHPPNNSTSYPPERHFLERTGRGKYVLRRGW